MTFTSTQLEYQMECGECNQPIKMTPDVLLAHLVEDHEYTAEEATAYMAYALIEADEEYQKALEDYYEDRAYERGL